VWLLVSVFQVVRGGVYSQRSFGDLTRELFPGDCGSADALFLSVTAIPEMRKLPLTANPNLESNAAKLTEAEG
jgi:hypothetical protein